MKSPAERLIDFYDQRIHRTVAHATPQADRVRAEAMRGFNRDFTTSHKAGEFRIADIDFDDVARHISSKNDHFRAGYRAFLEGLKDPEGMYKRRAESAALFDGMDRSQFMNVVQRCVPDGTLERCAQIGYDLILDCVGRRTVGCDVEFLSTGPIIDGIDFGCENAEDEPRRFVGVNSGVRTRIAPREHLSIGFAMKGSLNCGGLNDVIRNVIDTQTLPQWEKGLARFIIRMLTNSFCPDSCGLKYLPQLNGCRYKPYYAPGEGGPWTNHYCLDQDLDACHAQEFVCAIEQLMDEACDPLDGEAITCCPDGFQVLMFGSGCTVENFLDFLKPTTVSVKEQCDPASPPSCQTERTFQKAARSSWGEVKRSNNATRIYREMLTDLYGPGTTMNFDAAQIDQMVNRSMVIGCIRETFELTVEMEWTRSTYGGRNTWAWFNQRVEEFIGFDAARGFYVDPLRLPGVIFVQGVPDGIACDALTC